MAKVYTNSSEPDFNMSSFDALRKSSGFYNRNELEFFNKFSRFGFLDPWNTMLNTKEYIFFTKPDLHLFNNSSGWGLNPEIANIPFFMESFKRYYNVMASLQKSLKVNKSPFINLLSNMVNSNLDLPSITAEVVETASTVYGTNIKYQMSTITSDQNFEFSLEFNDTMYLHVYYLFKIWNEYQTYKSIITPPDDNYTINKILHDQICCYKFIVADDGETILYYAKYYGVFPKNVPRDTFGNLSKEGGLSYSINFNSTFVKDLDPTILNDFNNLTKKYISTDEDIPLYDLNNNCMNGEWCNIPYIVYDSNLKLAPMGMYKLKWR